MPMIAVSATREMTDDEKAEYLATFPPGYPVEDAEFPEVQFTDTREMTAEEEADWLARRAVTREKVDVERDRRIVGGMTFEGVAYQTREEDRENVHGAATMALAVMALGGGAPGDLRWHDGDEDFAWIAADNSLTAMDAPTVFNFAKAMAAHKSAHIFAGRGLKNMSPIPADYCEDSYWP